MASRVTAKAIQIDASMNCQLACPLCPTASGEVAKHMDAGHLDPVKFAALLDANPSIAQVELSNYGEMFLNPRLAAIMRIAWERQVVLSANNGVNLNFAREDALEALVRYRFRSLNCSIDGATQETYSQYRVKGNLDRVLDHLRTINRLKREHRTAFPLLRWQYIVFGHNEHEIEAARKLAQELGMHFAPKLSWDAGYSPIRDRHLVQIATGSAATTREEHYQSTGQDYMRSICHQLWNGPVLNWDGRMNGCCRNFWGDFGSNAFAEGLDAAVNSEPMNHARAMLMGRAPERADLPCTTCALYQTMKQDGRWLTEAEVAPHPSRVLCSFVIDAGALGATHAEVAALPGNRIQRFLMSLRAQRKRIDLTRHFSVEMELAPGDYLISVHPQGQPPVTKRVCVAPRPLIQEFAVECRA